MDELYAALELIEYGLDLMDRVSDYDEVIAEYSDDD